MAGKIKKKFLKICEWCGDEFETTNPQAKCCCIKCRIALARKTMEENPKKCMCLTCGATFMSVKTGKYCSKNCREIANGRRKKTHKLTREPSFTLEEVCKLARAAGLSYGQYVAKYNLK